MERDEAARDRIETIKLDTHDALDEAKHRVEAGAEKAKRAVQGDAMPLGDRIASHFKETGHDVAAEVDKTKRSVRDGENG